MRVLLWQNLIGSVQRSIDFTAQTAGAMTAAAFLSTFGMVFANASTERSLQLDPNTLQTGVAAGSARFDASSGTTELLIEEAKTAYNLFTGVWESRPISGGTGQVYNLGWGSGGGAGFVTVTRTFADGPDIGHGGGSATACRVQHASGVREDGPGNAWSSTLPVGVSHWAKNHAGGTQTIASRFGLPYFSYAIASTWSRFTLNTANNIGGTLYTPSTNGFDPTFPAIDVLIDCPQFEPGYVSSYMPRGTRAAGDQLTDALANWIDSGQLNVGFTFRPQAAPTTATSAARIFTIKNAGGTVIAYAEISNTTGTCTVLLNGVTVSGNVAQWAPGDLVDVFVSIGTGGTASIGYRRNGGPCVSLIYVALAGTVTGNTIAWFSHYGAQVLAGGYRSMQKYGGNTTGPDWYIAGNTVPLVFDFSGQPLGRMTAAQFQASYPYHAFLRAGAAGVITSPATFDVSLGIDEPGFGSYDGTNEGLSTLETRTSSNWTDPRNLAPGGHATTNTPTYAGQTSPDGTHLSTRVQSSGGNQYSGFVSAIAGPNVASCWVISTDHATHALSKFYNFGSVSVPYTTTGAWQWMQTDQITATDLMPVTSTATGMDVVADWVQYEPSSKYATDPILAQARAPSVLLFTGLNAWLNGAGQLRMEIVLVPCGGSNQPSYAKERFIDCASGDYVELDVATGIVTVSIGGSTSVAADAIAWTNRRQPISLFIEIGGSSPTRIFYRETTNPATRIDDGASLGAIAAPGTASLLSDLTRAKNVSGLLIVQQVYPVGTWPSWVLPVPVSSGSATNGVICVGDSITAGSAGSATWRTPASDWLGTKWSFTSVAIAGQTLATARSLISTQVTPNLDPTVRNQVVCMCGVNDLRGGAGSGATLYGNWTGYATDVLAVVGTGGAVVDDLILCTVTPQGAAATDSPEVERQIFLSMVDGYSPPAKVTVVRVDADWILSRGNAALLGGTALFPPRDPLWYVDAGAGNQYLHPTTSGQHRLAGWIVNALAGLP